jgi:hypothetical protein
VAFYVFICQPNQQQHDAESFDKTKRSDGRQNQVS